jgi:hypothetical protein
MFSMAESGSAGEVERICSIAVYESDAASGACLVARTFSIPAAGSVAELEARTLSIWA